MTYALAWVVASVLMVAALVVAADYGGRFERRRLHGDEAVRLAPSYYFAILLGVLAVFVATFGGVAFAVDRIAAAL